MLGPPSACSFLFAFQWPLPPLPSSTNVLFEWPQKKDILTKFTSIAPVHSRVGRGKKIASFLIDKVKLLDLHKQKPKLGCHPLAELFQRDLQNQSR